MIRYFSESILHESNQQFCCSLISLKDSDLILISLKIYKKGNQKRKASINAPKLPAPSINPPITNWSGNQKSIKERKAQIAKQVATKDYIDYYEVRWLAPHHKILKN